MSASKVLEKANQLGISLELLDGKVRYRPASNTPPDFIEMLRLNKKEVIHVLTSRGSCGNPRTPHWTHMIPSRMCNLTSCGCYREYGQPLLCEGIPCPWIFPKIETRERK